MDDLESIIFENNYKAIDYFEICKMCQKFLVKFNFFFTYEIKVILSDFSQTFMKFVSCLSLILPLHMSQLQAQD